LFSGSKFGKIRAMSEIKEIDLERESREAILNPTPEEAEAYQEALGRWNEIMELPKKERAEVANQMTEEEQEIISRAIGWQFVQGTLSKEHSEQKAREWLLAHAKHRGWTNIEVGQI